MTNPILEQDKSYQFIIKKRIYEKLGLSKSKIIPTYLYINRIKTNLTLLKTR